MHLIKPVLICLLVGLGMGFFATHLLGQGLGSSPYLISIPAAFAPFFTGAFKLKKDD